MKDLKNVSIGLLVIAVLSFLGVMLLQHLGGLAVSGLERLASLDAVIVVALITGAVSIFVMIGGKIFEQRQETKRYLVEKREASYKEVISLVYKINEDARKQSKENERNPEDKEFEQLAKDMLKVSENLTLWGSNEVVKKWLICRQKMLQGDRTALFALEDVMFAIRGDVGYSKRGLQEGDMLRFFINDLDNPNK